ncbi:MAG: type I pullulanase [Turicibacter sp.]|nr:type I pullulanase [Turicibacter sp.]
MEKIYSYLDEHHKITLLINDAAKESVRGPFSLIDKTTGETIELMVNKVTELFGGIKYTLTIHGFITFYHTFELVDSGDLKTPLLLGGITRTEWFDQQFDASNAALGMFYAPSQTTFRIWSPTASQISVILYQDDEQSYDMTSNLNGIWKVTIPGDLEKVRYRYRITQSQQVREVTDPYGIASTANGTHSVVVDLRKTTPLLAPRPTIKQATDAVIYEVSIRDFTIHETAPVNHRGQYLGLAELDYLKDLGVTHIQILPFFDFEGVDELAPTESYNWGYNPSQYNVPEGSYATDPTDPYARINELKTLIDTLHEQGLGVIMDVVYNHVYERWTFPFEGIVPTYFYRYNRDGFATNSSGCGNDIASDRRMVRKFILDSVKFWLHEYKLDGFRFDLMGLLDIETMNEVRKICDAVDPNILLYGEGWNIPVELPEHKRATLHNAHHMPRISHFNDTFRDVIKGSTFDHLERGLVLGNTGLIDKGKHLLAGSSGRVVGEGFKFFKPVQSVNYVECHDNHTFWDRAKISNADESDDILRRRQLLATAMVVFAQGIPFIHGGQEFFRTKFGVENSYRDSDEINAIDWAEVHRHKSEIDLFKGYLEIRKAHGAFRFQTSALVKKHVQLSDYENSAIEYVLKDVAAYGPYEEVRVFFNLKDYPLIIEESFEGFSVIADAERSGIAPLRELGDELTLEPLSTTIIVK